MSFITRVVAVLSLIAAPLLQAADPVAAAAAHFRANARAYGLTDATRELRQRSARGDAQGYTHVRYDQYVDGVRVFQGEAIAHVDPRGRVEITNAIRGNLRVDTTPRVSEATAVATALNAIVPRGAYTTRTALEVLPRGADSLTTRLTWHVTVFVENEVDGNAQWEYFVDAHSGAIALSWDGTHRTMVPATAKTMYAGDRAIDVDAAADGRYYLRDTNRGGMYTLDMLSTTTTMGPVMSNDSTIFGDNLRNACNGGPNRLTAAADAQFGMAATWDYLATAFGRNGIDGVGGLVYAQVHWGSCINNASYSPATHAASFSDGTTGNYFPFVGLDVVAHEFGHGLTQFEAGLDTRGEPGGLNESSSDILGASVEFFVNSSVDTPDYLVGERIIVSNYAANGTFTPTSAIRYMDDPRKDGRSPACWSKNMRTSDIHLLGGPNNHMFYLLAEGGTSKCNGAVVTGVGRTKAAAIYYKALTDYMVATTNYAGARVACLNAAANLYGSASPEYAAVNAAFAAINVK